MDPPLAYNCVLAVFVPGTTDILRHARVAMGWLLDKSRGGFDVAQAFFPGHAIQVKNQDFIHVPERSS
jgi:hypothetical protein